VPSRSMGPERWRKPTFPAFEPASGTPVLHGRIPSGIQSGVFSGFNHGGNTGAYSYRGRSSFGGSVPEGGFHGGGFGGGIVNSSRLRLSFGKPRRN
jgi:hypothetical protein